MHTHTHTQTLYPGDFMTVLAILNLEHFIRQKNEQLTLPAELKQWDTVT